MHLYKVDMACERYQILLYDTLEKDLLYFLPLYTLKYHYYPLTVKNKETNVNLCEVPRILQEWING